MHVHTGDSCFTLKPCSFRMACASMDLFWLAAHTMANLSFPISLTQFPVLLWIHESAPVLLPHISGALYRMQCN